MARTLAGHLEQSTLNNGGAALDCAGKWARLSDTFTCSVTGEYLIISVLGTAGGRIAPSMAENYKLAISEDDNGYYMWPFEVIENLGSGGPGFGRLVQKGFVTSRFCFMQGVTYRFHVFGGAADSAIKVAFYIFFVKDLVTLDSLGAPTAPLPGEAVYAEDSEDYTSAGKDLSTEQTILTHTVTGRGAMLSVKPEIVLGTAGLPANVPDQYRVRVYVGANTVVHDKAHWVRTNLQEIREIPPFRVLDGETVYVKLTCVSGYSSNIAVLTRLLAGTDSRVGAIARDGNTVTEKHADGSTLAQHALSTSAKSRIS